MSDLSKVFEVDDIFTFMSAISEIIRVKKPLKSKTEIISRGVGDRFPVECNLIKIAEGTFLF
jgi:hypothetical protein